MPKCKVCKAPATLRINMASFCSYECAIVQARKAQEKARKRQQLEFRKETKSRREKAKTNAQWAAEAQVIFNKVRRLEELLWFKERGLEPYCISCQQPLGGDQWCNGHFKTRGARPDLAFDKLNSYLQHNRRCNQALSGDIEGYKVGLAKRFGENEARRIIDYCEIRQESPKRSAEDWIAFKKELSAEVRRLEKLL
jgi:hypothetical protein